MDPSTLVLIGIAVALFVYLDILFVELRRGYREASRLLARVAAYAELPVVAAAAKSTDDLSRLAAAVEAVPELAARAEAALATLGVRR